MNRCSFSEEETTNALNALYQVPISGIQNNQQSYPVGTATGGTLVEAQHLNQNCQDLSFCAVPSGGKKKLEAKLSLRSRVEKLLILPAAVLGPVEGFLSISLTIL